MYETNQSKTDCGNNLQQRWEEVRALGEAICTTLRSETLKIGLAEKALQIASWNRARFELQHDLASGQASLSGEWRDTNGQRVGSIIFHCDGSFYAEYDVIEQHPKDSRWFVEAVVAWGKHDTIKAELRLLPNVQ